MSQFLRNFSTIFSTFSLFLRNVFFWVKLMLESNSNSVFTVFLEMYILELQNLNFKNLMYIQGNLYLIKDVRTLLKILIKTEGFLGKRTFK